MDRSELIKQTRLRAIAIDDEQPALHVIRNYCNELDGLDLLGEFSKPSDALAFLEKNEVNLLFLDINMPSLSGIDLYRNLDQRIMVIFTTAYSEYAVEGFNLKALDYLLKPITPERFEQAVEKAREHFHYIVQNGELPQAYIMVKADYSLYKLYLQEIEYIEGLDDYLKIHLSNARPVVARMTMKAMLEQLPGTDFIRVHRSFIVPFRRIESVRNRVITLGKVEIPIGRSYESSFLERFQ
jgi:DNA-binding LytR/AlgR family response regulator